MKLRKKKHEKKQQHEQVRLKQKQRLEGVLEALKLLKGFRELPANVREVAFRFVPDQPKVVLSPTAQRSAVLEGLKALIEEGLAELAVPTTDKRAVPVLDFLSICCVLPRYFSSLTSAPLSHKYRAFVQQAAQVSAAFL